MSSDDKELPSSPNTGSKKRTAENVGLALTVLALTLALIQYRDSKNQLNRLEQQGQRLGEITQYISTQAAGTFPRNIDSIIGVVKKTKATIRIMCDAASYGHFSAPHQFSEYMYEIVKLRQEGKRVKLLICNEKAFGEAVMAQFKPSDFESLRQSQRFRDFFAKHNPGLRPVPATLPEFEDLLGRREKDIGNSMLEAGVEIRGVPTLSDLPFFLWLRDEDEEAIFSVYNVGRNAEEISFRTIDGNLLRALRETFDAVFEQKGKPATKGSLTTQTKPLAHPCAFQGCGCCI